MYFISLDMKQSIDDLSDDMDDVMTQIEDIQNQVKYLIFLNNFFLIL